MTYRGVVSNGVVVLEGKKPSDGTIVNVTPVPAPAAKPTLSASHPAIGIWKDRTDLPTDPVEASRKLGEQLMRRTSE